MKKFSRISCCICGQKVCCIPINNKLDIPVTCIPCATGKAPKKAGCKRRFANVKIGKRPDLGNRFFRSSMEANFTRILELLKIPYKYEERVFTFDCKNKPFQFIPDFEVLAKGEGLPPGWYETKGWMNPSSRSKLRRFKKNYPEEAKKLTVVIYKRSDRATAEFCKKEGFKTLQWDTFVEKYSTKIPTWE